MSNYIEIIPIDKCNERKIDVRVTHKGCDFRDDIKLPKSVEFEGVSVFTFCMTLVDVYK